MAPKIPDRWIKYKPVGEKIEGTRFIAFKVPLKEDIARNVDKDIRLDRDILLKSVPNLGLIIDLTNTNRYYDPKIFQKQGVDYRKLMIPGHETPAKYLVDKFIGIVKEFMENNADNDKLIGVHCTHGVNRTGYLICNYMISQMTIDPNEAMDRFANARGHKIERNNYIDALHKVLIPSNPEQRHEPEVIIEKERSPHKSTNTRDRSIEKDKRDKEEKVVYRTNRNDSRDRSLYRSNRNDSRDESVDRDRHYERNRRHERDTNNSRSRHKERSRDRYSDDLHRRHRTPDNYRSSSRSRYNRKSRSPSPYFANNRRSNYSYRSPANDYRRIERPYYAKPPEPQEPLRIPYSHQPPPMPPTSRLRLDYYNARPVDNKPTYNRQRYTYVRKTNHL